MTNQMPVCCYLKVQKSLQNKILNDGIGATKGGDGYSGGDVKCGCGRSWRLAWVEVVDDE